MGEITVLVSARYVIEKLYARLKEREKKEFGEEY